MARVFSVPAVLLSFIWVACSPTVIPVGTPLIAPVIPTLTSVTPNAGALAGGTLLTLRGSNFVSGMSIKVDGLDCSSGVVNSSSLMTCLTPAHVAGAVPIRVTHPNTEFVELPGAYTYQPAPVVQGVSPSSGPRLGGTTLTLTGTGFVAGAQVKVGGSACANVTFDSSSQLRCESPMHAVGSVGVEVTNADTQSGSLAGAFEYIFTQLTTVAGPLSAEGSENGTFAQSRFFGLTRMVYLANALYVCDTENHVIRKVDLGAGTVSLLAGGVRTIGSADGVGAAARFNEPRGIATDGTYLYIADSQNFRIRRIEISTATVTTFAGGSYGYADGVGVAASFKRPYALAWAAGFLYVTDGVDHLIRKIQISNANVTTLAGQQGVSGSADGLGALATLNRPEGITYDADRDVFYFVDLSSYTIRKLTPAGDVTTLAGTAGSWGTADGVGAAARFYNPRDVVYFGGFVYVADEANSRIRKVDVTNGNVVTLAGGVIGPQNNGGSLDGIGTNSSFSWPSGLATDGTTLWVADTRNHHLRSVNLATSAVNTIVGSAGSYGTLDGTGASARMDYPKGMDSDGTYLYFADQYNHTVRRLDPATGAVVTLAGLAGTYGSTNGTGTAARFYLPEGLVYHAGYLYVADYPNCKIRKLDLRDNSVTTFAGSSCGTFLPGVGVAARFDRLAGLATDGTFLYLADTYNHQIAKIQISDANVSLLSGTGASGADDGAAGVATFSSLSQVVYEGGFLYVADSSGTALRKVNVTNGSVTTLAGVAGATGHVDGTGSTVRMYASRGLASDGTYLYLADGVDSTVRKMNLTTGVVSPFFGGFFKQTDIDGDFTAGRTAAPQWLYYDKTATVPKLYMSNLYNLRAFE